MTAVGVAGPSGTLPQGYVELPSGVLPAGVAGVARADVAAEIAAAAGSHGTLHDWAAARPDRRALHGRGVAWAVKLDSGLAVVVRHNRHGGLLAPVTGDRFLAPTRAPAELLTALALADAGVATPQVVAFVTYPAPPVGALLRRADVATAEIVGAHDLPAALERWPGRRPALLAATAHLLRSLTAAGARHPDLNVKNILLTSHGDGAAAHVIDVDRIVFGRRGDPGVARANLDRLFRSARKWRQRRGALIDAAELLLLERLTLEGE